MSHPRAPRSGLLGGLGAAVGLGLALLPPAAAARAAARSAPPPLPPASVAAGYAAAGADQTPSGPPPAAPVRHYTAADLPALRAALADATAAATAAAADAQRAALADVGVRIRLDAAAQAVQDAQDAVSAEVRRVAELGEPTPLQALITGDVSASDLAAGRIQDARRVGLTQGAVQRVADTERALTALQPLAAARRSRLLVKAAAVEAAQVTARALLDQASALVAADEAAQAALAAQRAVLDAQAALVAQAVAPAVTARGASAAAAEAPVIAALEATPSGQLPPGYSPTGPAVAGVSSWYGPGFVGSPTATGAPYNPERFTAAMLTVPLGTVVHVTGPTGLTVNVLVDDRGPYVAGRLIDLSAAAARAIGVGLSPVTVQVLAASG